MKDKRMSVRVISLVMVMATIFLSVFAITANAEGEPEKVYSDVMYDLQQDSNFDVSDYKKDNNNPDLNIITVAESEHGDIYVYVYIPAYDEYGIRASTISMASYANDNSEELITDNYELEYINSNSVFFKYRVKGLTQRIRPKRIYEIYSILRPFHDHFDDVSEGDNAVAETACKIGKKYEFTTVGGDVDYIEKDIETIEVTSQYIAFLRYKTYAGYQLSNDEYLDRHFIAFSTNYDIDRLMSVEIKFKVYERTTEYYTIDAFIDFFKYGRILDSTQYPYNEKGVDEHRIIENEEYEIKNNIFNPSGGTKWSRIEKADEFIQSTSPGIENIFDTNILVLDENAKNIISQQDWVINFYETKSWKISDEMGYSAVSKRVSEVLLLRLEFESAGRYYNLGVVADKQTGSDKPAGYAGYEQWFEKIIQLLMILFLLIVVCMILPALWPALLAFMLLMLKCLKIVFKVPIRFFKRITTTKVGKIVTATLCLAVLCGAVFGVYALVGKIQDNNNNVVMLKYESGGFTANGIECENEYAVRSDIFSCEGLKVMKDFEADFNLKAYYYDENKQFLKCEEVGNNYESDYLLAKYARIVAERKEKINVWDIPKIQLQIQAVPVFYDYDVVLNTSVEVGNYVFDYIDNIYELCLSHAYKFDFSAVYNEKYNIVIDDGENQSALNDNGHGCYKYDCNGFSAKDFVVSVIGVGSFETYSGYSDIVDYIKSFEIDVSFSIDIEFKDSNGIRYSLGGINKETGEIFETTSGLVSDKVRGDMINVDSSGYFTMADRSYIVNLRFYLYDDNGDYHGYIEKSPFESRYSVIIPDDGYCIICFDYLRLSTEPLNINSYELFNEACFYVDYFAMEFDTLFLDSFVDKFGFEYNFAIKERMFGKAILSQNVVVSTGPVDVYGIQIDVKDISAEYDMRVALYGREEEREVVSLGSTDTRICCDNEENEYSYNIECELRKDGQFVNINTQEKYDILCEFVDNMSVITVYEGDYVNQFEAVTVFKASSIRFDIPQGYYDDLANALVFDLLLYDENGDFVTSYSTVTRSGFFNFVYCNEFEFEKEYRVAMYIYSFSAMLGQGGLSYTQFMNSLNAIGIEIQ